MVGNSLLNWLRGVNNAQKGQVIGRIKGLGVTSFQGNVQLFYTTSANTEKILSAISPDGLAFTFAGEVHFSPEHHGDFLEQIRFYRQDELIHAQYKVLSQTRWRPSVTHDLKVFAPDENAILEEPLVELHEPETKKRVQYSGAHNIWSNGTMVLSARRGSFDDGSLMPEACFKIEEGIMLIYSSRTKTQDFMTFTVGAALFDADHTDKLLWRSDEPLWNHDAQWKDKNIVPIGVVLFNQHLYMYVQVEDEGVHIVLLPAAALANHIRYHATTPSLQRHNKNPLITPSHDNAWEAFTTFNAAALYANDKFHLVYRAQGHDYVSVLGYASSKDGLAIDEKLDEPIYYPREQFEEVVEKPAKLSYKYMSAGYGGSEDPRLTLIDDRVYMTYVAFDGVNPPRVALTSIALEDFLSKNWQWERSVLISPPGIVDKNAVIFPEKIHGKYVIMHRIFPDILIDFVDTLKFNGTWWLEGHHKISPRPDKWDSRKIGAGPPPMKTEEGWLLIYQAVGNQDPGKYKIGAMLLDLHDPTKVLYRSQNPILEPETWYENEGFKPGVVYPCGAVIKDNILFVYYGGADSHVCVATAMLDEFLDNLKRQKEISLKPAILPLSL